MFKLFKIVTITSILLVLLILGARGYYLAALNRPSLSDKTLSITVESGMGVNEIAKLLAENGLIHSEILFKIYLQLNNLAATLQAGEYEVSPHLNLKETVALLQHGTFDLKLTFPEGWRREEMAEYLEEAAGNLPAKAPLGAKAEEFLAASEGMEGYLFPETYLVPKDTNAEELVKMMRKMFDAKFTKELRDRAAQRNLSVEEVVILASIVEREVKLDEDRAPVAGILIKRWRSGWPLEADATVQFAVANSRQLSAISGPPTGEAGQPEWWPKKLTNSDLEIDSPYNTRKYRGLPPGPICNPGLKALKAVVGYKESSYWFYISDKGGKTLFSKTLDEHNQKVLKYTAG